VDLLKPSYASGYAKNASQSAHPNLWDGLVGAWMPSLGVTGETLRDVSGNGNHGTLQYDTSWKTNNSETSLYFDRVQDHVSGFGDVSLSSTEPFTIVSKVRLNSFLDRVPTICQIKTNTSYAFVVAASLIGGYEGIFFGSTNSWIRLKTGNNFATNITQSIVILYNGNDVGTASNFSMYLDGKQVNLSTAGMLIGLTQNNYLGTINAGSRGTDDWHGNINSFSIYNRALSPSEIKQLYVDSLAPFRTKKRTVVRVPAAIPAATKVGSIKKPTTIIKPSYQSGYARNASESENPKLWDGLVGAWMPSLGVTGETLRDVSGNGNHGTLTGMDAASDWVVTGKGLALDFDGVNDYVRFNRPEQIVNGGAISISIWVKWITTGSSVSDIQILVDNFHSSTGFAIQDRPDLSKRLSFYIARNPYGLLSTGQIGDGSWKHVVCTNDRVYSRLYVNGVLDNYIVDSGGINQVNPLMNIGSFQTGGRYLNGDVSNLSIYNRALSPSEIKQLYVDSLAPFRKKQRVSVAVPAAVAPSATYHPLRSLAHPLEQ